MFDEMDRLDRWRERLKDLLESGVLGEDARDVPEDVGDCSMCGDTMEPDLMSEWVDSLVAWAAGPRDPDLESPLQSCPTRCGHCGHVLGKDD